MNQPVRLEHRSVIAVSGPDRDAFLNGILTLSLASLGPDALGYGALLNPQGKVISDMFLSRRDGAILIDCPAPVASRVVERLNLMKLRAAVSVGVRPDLAVTAFRGLPDPRASDAPARAIGETSVPGDIGAYHAARIRAGLPEQGADFSAEEVFPADINMDMLGGVDFRKGCFIGQEVVSRMKRRSTARRRTLRVQLSAAHAAPAALKAGEEEIGTLTSVSGLAGLARVRIDRLEEALTGGRVIRAGEASVTFDRPEWLADELSALARAKEARHDAGR